MKLGKVLKGISTALIIIVVAFAILTAGVQLIGLKPYTVLSGSMEPTYQTGSLIYVRKADPEKLKVNDIITFKLTGDTTATHRIIEIVPDENDASIKRFRTKGDANDVIDGSLVDFDSVIGTPIFTIPLLGYVLAFIHGPVGIWFTLALALLIILFVFIADAVEEEEKKKEEN